MPLTARYYHGHSFDALDLLRADHDKLRRLFSEFDSLRGNDDEDERKCELIEEICYELTLHAMIEEEIFYPAVRAAIDCDDLIDDCELEHAGTRELIGALEELYPGDEHYELTVTVLAEEVIDHIEREEADLFATARASGIDLSELCGLLIARKDALDDDLSAPPLPDTLRPHPGVRRTPRLPD